MLLVLLSSIHIGVHDSLARSFAAATAGAAAHDFVFPRRLFFAFLSLRLKL